MDHANRYGFGFIFIWFVLEFGGRAIHLPDGFGSGMLILGLCAVSAVLSIGQLVIGLITEFRRPRPRKTTTR